MTKRENDAGTPGTAETDAQRTECQLTVGQLTTGQLWAVIKETASKLDPETAEMVVYEVLKTTEPRHLENIRIPTENIIDCWSRGSLTMEQAFDMMVDWSHDPEVACDMLRSRDATLHRKQNEIIYSELAGVI